jgi:hypothetical protein
MDASKQVNRPEAGIDPTMGRPTCDSQQSRLSLSSTASVGSCTAQPLAGYGPAMSVVHACGISDAFAVIKIVRANQAVLLNCSQLTGQLSSRLIDICSGGVCAMDGQVHRISAELVLFAPALTRVACA